MCGREVENKKDSLMMYVIKLSSSAVPTGFEPAMCMGIIK